MQAPAPLTGALNLTLPPLPELFCQLSTAPVLEQAGRALCVAALGAVGRWGVLPTRCQVL